MRQLTTREALRELSDRGIPALEVRIGTADASHVSEFGGRELRLSAEQDVQVRAAADGAAMTVRGHAAVFNRLSLDLGYFTERIAEGAFDGVLNRNPQVTINYLHDDRYLLGSTRGNAGNGDLELRVDAIGLRFYSHVMRDPDTGAYPSYATDLGIAMQTGNVRQASFAFIVGRDEWLIDSDDNVTRTILEVAELYDVCVCPMGAYPQTDSELVRTLRAFACTRSGTGPGLTEDATGASTDAALQEAASATQQTVAAASARRRVASARAMQTIRGGTR